MQCFKLILCIIPIFFLIAACKKDPIANSQEKENTLAHLAGNAWYKPKLTSSDVNFKKKTPIIQKSKKTEIGTFYTSHGTLTGIRFHALDGKEVILERSKAPGALSYNRVTDVGRYVKNEQLSLGLTKSEMIKLGEAEKWPSYIIQEISRD